MRRLKYYNADKTVFGQGSAPDHACGRAHDALRESGGEGLPLPILIPTRLRSKGRLVIPPHPTLGERRELSKRGPRRSPGRKRFYQHCIGISHFLDLRGLRSKKWDIPIQCTFFCNVMSFVHSAMHCSTWCSPSVASLVPLIRPSSISVQRFLALTIHD